MFFTTHTLPGDPAEVLARKREHFDPVVDRLAPGHGAILSITVRHEDGVTVYNLWDSAEGAAAFTREPDAQAAQQAAGLPLPSQFARFDQVEITDYRTTAKETPGTAGVGR